MRQPLHTAEFLQVAKDALSTGDAQCLAERVSKKWNSPQIRTLLFHPDTDVRRVAAVVLGLIGQRDDVPTLARALWDMDEQVNQMAEHSMWAIWFRSGASAAVRPFREGVALLGVEDHQRAANRFQAAVAVDPDFAEAYHQLGIARSLDAEWQATIRAYIDALRREPFHFRAVAGLGHAYAELEDLRRARRCYRKALQINPRLASISRTIRQLEQTKSDEKEDSGEFTLDEILA